MPSTTLAGLSRPVRMTVTVSAATAVRLEAVCAQDGVSKRQAVEEAVGWWLVKREQALERQARLQLQRGLRDAGEGVPVGELLDRFRAQIAGLGLTAVPASGRSRLDLESGPRDVDASGGPDTKEEPSVPPQSLPEPHKPKHPSGSADSLEQMNIRERRNRVGITQQQLAERARVSIASVKLYEAGYTSKRESQVVQRMLAVLTELEARERAA